MTSNYHNLEDLITSEMKNKEKQEIQDEAHENSHEEENNSNSNQVTPQQFSEPAPEPEKLDNQIENNSNPENNQDPAWYIQVYEDKINNLKNENNLLKSDNVNLHNQLKLHLLSIFSLLVLLYIFQVFLK